jgi:transcriptional repressor NrdR
MYCGSLESHVIDSRPTEDGSVIRRRRECDSCSRRFTTYEKAEKTPLLVIKNDGRREAFDVEKVRLGIIKSCGKRPVTAAQIDNVVRDIEADLYNLAKEEVQSETIGQMVMDKLAQVDEVSYVRFASVYRRFKDIKAFQEALTQFCDK